MRYRFYVADVFTEHAFGGNPLAVFPDARGLTDAQMQRAANEFNLSETVFVLPAEKSEHTRRLRIFTPARELPFAGHPTVGSAYVLASIGEIELEGEETSIVFEEGVGPVRVLIKTQDARPVFTQLSAAMMPEFGPPPPPRAELAAMLSLDESDLLDSQEPRAASCGLPFLFIALVDRDALRRARLRLDAFERTLSSYWTQLVYIFTYDAEREGSDLRARLFAPGAGVPEDPATGSAATALAGLLAHRLSDASGTFRWVIEQGFEMGRPSIIESEADKEAGEVVAVRVGGSSVMISEGWMEIPDPG